MERVPEPHRDGDACGDVPTPAAALQESGAPQELPANPRARFILNPVAGQTYRLGDLEETIGYLVRQGWELSLRETRQPGEAMSLAQEAAGEGMDIVFAVGGDGTVNEVVNGLATTQTALAVLPLGSGNGWAREQGLDMEPVAAAHTLAQGQIRAADLGMAGSHYFLLMASVGFDAAVVQALSGEAKQAFWPLGYMIQAISMAVSFAGENTVVTLDDRQVEGETVIAIISNARIYGALAQIAPNASIDDGLLDVCILRGKGGLPQISLFTIGALLQRPEIAGVVDYYRSREVTITSKVPFYVQTDGDLLGTTPMTFRAVPRALRILVPQQVPPGLFAQPGRPPRAQDAPARSQMENA